MKQRLLILVLPIVAIQILWGQSVVLRGELGPDPVRGSLTPGFLLKLRSEQMHSYQIESSKDMLNWLPGPIRIGTGEEIEENLGFHFQHEFFRVRVGNTSIQIRPGYFLASDGARIYYEVAGTGPSLILVHSEVRSSVSWEPQILGLADRYQIVRYDLRHYGKSDKTGPHPRESWTWSQDEHRLSRDLLELMTHVGVTTSSICGVSIGSAIAAQFAVFHPDRVSKLVLLSPSKGQTFTAAQPEHIEKLKAQSSKILLVAGIEDAPALLEIDAARENGLRPALRIFSNAGSNLAEQEPGNFNQDLLAYLGGQLQEPPKSPPIISALENVIFERKLGPTGEASFQVFDLQTDSKALRVTAASSNPNLIPTQNLRISNLLGASSFSISYQPIADKAGETQISVVATDSEGLSSQRQFIITVPVGGYFPASLNGRSVVFDSMSGPVVGTTVVAFTENTFSASNTGRGTYTYSVTGGTAVIHLAYTAPPDFVGDFDHFIMTLSPGPDLIGPFSGSTRIGDREYPHGGTFRIP